MWNKLFAPLGCEFTTATPDQPRSLVTAQSDQDLTVSSLQHCHHVRHLGRETRTESITGVDNFDVPPKQSPIDMRRLIHQKSV